MAIKLHLNHVQNIMEREGDLQIKLQELQDKQLEIKRLEAALGNDTHKGLIYRNTYIAALKNMTREELSALTQGEASYEELLEVAVNLVQKCLDSYVPTEDYKSLLHGDRGGYKF
jgi:hypothetical protein